MHRHLLFHFKKDHFHWSFAGILQRVVGKDWAGGNRCRDASAWLDWDGVGLGGVGGVAVLVDGDLVAFNDVDQVVLVVVENVRLARCNDELAGDPVVVFGKDLVACWADRERRDGAFNVAARLAGWHGFHEKDVGFLGADVLDLVGAGRKNWGSAGWDFDDVRVGWRVAIGNLELGWFEKVHLQEGVGKAKGGIFFVGEKKN